MTKILITLPFLVEKDDYLLQDLNSFIRRWFIEAKIKRTEVKIEIVKE